MAKKTCFERVGDEAGKELGRLRAYYEKIYVEGQADKHASLASEDLDCFVRESVIQVLNVLKGLGPEAHFLGRGKSGEWVVAASEDMTASGRGYERLFYPCALQGLSVATAKELKQLDALGALEQGRAYWYMGEENPRLAVRREFALDFEPHRNLEGGFYGREYVWPVARFTRSGMDLLPIISCEEY